MEDLKWRERERDVREGWSGMEDRRGGVPLRMRGNLAVLNNAESSPGNLEASLMIGVRV